MSSRDYDSSSSSSSSRKRRRRHSRGSNTTDKMMQVATANGSVTTFNNDDQQQQQFRGGWISRVVQKLKKWSFVYNVTTGLYMLDVWERCLFNVVFLVFLLVAGYNSGHYISKFASGFLAWCADDDLSQFLDNFGGQHLRAVLGSLAAGPRGN